MKELLRRLFLHPFLAVEILTATFFIAMLQLALPLFVINLLNRYVTYGFDGTLITLSVGMLIAVVLQFGFRVARTKMLGPVSAGPDNELSEKVLDAVARARVLELMPGPRIQETLADLQTVQSTYDIPTFNAVLDMPFSLLYILVAFFLSPVLALVAFIGMLCALAFGQFSLIQTRKTIDAVQELSTAHRGMILSAVQSGDTMRAFDGRGFLTRIWRDQIQKLTSLRLRLADRREQSQSFILTSSILMSVAMYAIGATFVVKGDLTVGALIGANILASRAYQSVVRFEQTRYMLKRARDAFQKIEDFLRLPLEGEGGTAIRQYKGSIRFRDLGFAYPGATGPLFESVDLDLQPGKTLIVTGRNGVGKTTLARLILGLLIPSRGEILIDGISLHQIATGWWRRQIIYFPQEPTFLNATIRENLTLIHSGNEGAVPGDEVLNVVIKAADLRPFLDRTREGLETRLADGGRYLSPGIRRRLALARALVTNGRITVFDEPTEGLDAEGCDAVYNVMNNMIKSGRTIIAFSNDPLILKGATYILDLNEKPVPRLMAGESKKGRVH